MAWELKSSGAGDLRWTARRLEQLWRMDRRTDRQVELLWWTVKKPGRQAKPL